VQARHSDGQLSVGAATANGPLGPFTDVGAPLVHESNMGHIGMCCKICVCMWGGGLVCGGVSCRTYLS
jgi:hypothetical protein